MVERLKQNTERIEQRQGIVFEGQWRPIDTSIPPWDPIWKSATPNPNSDTNLTSLNHSSAPPSQPAAREASVSTLDVYGSTAAKFELLKRAEIGAKLAAARANEEAESIGSLAQQTENELNILAYQTVLQERSNEHARIQPPDHESIDKYENDVPKPADNESHLPPSFFRADVGVEKSKRKLSRKAWAIASASVALVVGGGITAASMLPSETSHSQADSDALSQTPAALDNAPADAPKVSDVKVSAKSLGVGDCFDAEGNGKAIVSLPVSIEANMKWNVAMLDGTTTILENETWSETPGATGPFPKLEIKNAEANVAACMDDELSAIEIVDDTSVNINWDHVDMQMSIQPGATLPEAEAWIFDPTPGVTDRATVADLVADMADRSVNEDVASPIAVLHAVEHVYDNETLKSKIQTETPANLAGEIQKRAPGLKVTFTGTQKPPTYKGVTVPSTDKFEVTDILVSHSSTEPSKE